jgi:MraZ protein
MIFLGTFIHNLDDKNRIVLPAKLLVKLTKKIVISKGFDGCLELRNEGDFEQYANSLMKLTQTKKDSRIVIRQLLANACDLEIDTSKRILIPNNLLVEANINKEIIIIGVGDKIEL